MKQINKKLGLSKARRLEGWKARRLEAYGMGVGCAIYYDYDKVPEVPTARAMRVCFDIEFPAAGNIPYYIRQAFFMVPAICGRIR